MISAKFIFAGKAVFTVENNKGEKFTYKLNKSKKYPGSFFLDVKEGRYFEQGGWLKEAGLDYFKGYSRFTSEDKAIKVLLWALGKVVKQEKLPEGYSINHEGMCGKCGKELTDTLSIKVGLGPICRANKKDKQHVHTSGEKSLLEALKKTHKDVIDVYISRSTETSRGWSTRVVFKEGVDFYTNVERISIEDIADDVSNEIHLYKLALLGFK